MSVEIALGKIVNTHGLRGELKVSLLCDGPDDIISAKKVNIEGREFKVDSAKIHKNHCLVRLEGVDSIEAAEMLKNKTISALREDLPSLPEGVYYMNDLIGLSVYQQGELIGVVSDCFPTGSNDVYVVKREQGKDILLPAIKQVVKSIDTDRKVMEVELMEGLIPDEG